MKKITKILFFCLSAFLLFYSSALMAQTFVPTNPSNKNVILEVFTGNNCTFCPLGHRIADSISANNPGRVWNINIHHGGFSSNDPQYKTDWASLLATQYGVYSYPIGTVNRGSSAYGRDSWGGITDQTLAQASPVNVAAQGIIDTSNRKLFLVVEVYYTDNAAEATNKLNVVMRQNNIIGNQSGASGYPAMQVGSQYKHNRMLRDLITGQWGIDINTTTAGSFWTHTFIYDIPEHISYNGSTANTPLVVLADLEFIVFVAENQKSILSGAKANVECTKFVAVNNITNVPTTATATQQLHLTGSVVPNNATSQTITWSVDDAGTTGATISGTTLNTTNPGTVTVRATIEHGLAFETPYTQIFNITVGNVGVTEMHNPESLQVYPNPTTGQLTIENGQLTINSVEIFDVMGKKQKSRKAEEQNIVLDISNFPNGVYFVKITTEHGVVTKKAIKL